MPISDCPCCGKPLAEHEKIEWMGDMTVYVCELCPREGIRIIPDDPVDERST